MSSADERMAGASAEPMIVFDGVSKRFGDHEVLRSLNFTVGPGEHVCLIGPSGSGKTTILRLLMTLEKPDAGKIYVGGQCLTHMPEMRSRSCPVSSGRAKATSDSALKASARRWAASAAAHRE